MLHRRVRLIPSTLDAPKPRNQLITRRRTKPEKIQASTARTPGRSGVRLDTGAVLADFGHNEKWLALWRGWRISEPPRCITGAFLFLRGSWKGLFGRGAGPHGARFAPCCRVRRGKFQSHRRNRLEADFKDFNVGSTSFSAGSMPSQLSTADFIMSGLPL